MKPLRTDSIHAPAESYRVPRRLVFILAAATGLTVANLYYVQPLLAQIAHSFHTDDGQAGLIAILTQVGYAAGLMFLVPLGDVLERTRLVVLVLLGAAISLVAAAFAPSITILALIGLAIGLTSVVAQILVPFAADLASDEDRGQVVGMVMSGLLIGVLLARTVAGVVAGLWTWRAMFAIAALLMVVLAAVLWFVLPRRTPNTPLPYPALLRSVLALVRHEPLLRRRSLYGALGFGAFNVFWSTAAFLLAGPSYGYGTAIIGAFGLVGAAGALAASAAGRLSDQGHTNATTGAAAGAIAVSFALLLLGGHQLIALIVGIILLDIGAQGLHISNQSVIYRLSGQARSRITTAYMTSYFIGGSLGSALSVWMYTIRGWDGVCVLGGILGALMVAVWFPWDRLVGRNATGEQSS
jgi:predicted MFS family arabinose efflux permease